MIKQLTLLNETVLKCLDETNETKILKAFTEVGLKILGADYGFVWLKSPVSEELKLTYKSPNLPFIPSTPQKKGRKGPCPLPGEP